MEGISLTTKASVRIQKEIRLLLDFTGSMAAKNQSCVVYASYYPSPECS